MLGPKHTTRFSAAAVAVAGSLSLGFAAEDILWTWDTPDLLGSWGTAWGQAQTIQDPWEDNTGNNGGSLYISTDYRGPLPEENRNVITVMGNHGPWLWNGEVRINLVEYERLEFDIKWDTANATLTLEQFNTAGGDNGLVLWSARHDGSDWQWVEIGRTLIPSQAADGWVPITLPIIPTTANLDRSAGIVFKKWVPQDVADAGGVAAFWIDNLRLVASDIPIAPPTVSLSSKVTEGLNLITLAGSEWQRQGIRTVGDTFSWVGSATPTTYEFTVREMPDPAYAGLHTHIFLVPRDTRTSVGVDWDRPDVVRFEMSQQGDGNFLGTFRYKIDAPGSNGGMFGGEGELGSVSSSTGIGSWGITFNDDTSITIFSPEATTDLVLPDTVAAKFNDALTVYFGTMPNAPARVGQKAVLGQVRIQGAAGGVNVTDDFTGPLNTGIWELAAEHPAGVMVLTDTAALWLGWTLPDTGFSPEVASEINASAWAPFTPAAPPLPTGPTKSVLITTAELPGTSVGYWRLLQRQFSKLQILLPGETAAPGTPTGKTGTPAPQTQYVPFEVTVNAVDGDWVVMTDVSDTVTLTTTDLDAELPPDAVLVNGTATLQVDLGTVGSQTLTVSNVTDPTIQPDTSSPVAINP